MTENILMKYWLFLSISILLGYPVFCQQQQVIEGQFRIVQTDYLGNIYTLSSSNVLEKRNGQGKVVCSYNDKSKGIITDFDASNPLRIIVNFGDVGLIGILDNTLSLTNSIDVFSLGFNNNLVTNQAMENGLWVFDNASRRLFKYDRTLKVIYESGNINSNIGFDFTVTQLVELGNYVFMNSDKGILVFDTYGTYVKQLDYYPSRINAWKDFVYFNDDSSQCSLDSRNAISSCTEIKANEAINIIKLNEDKEIRHMKDRLVIATIPFDKP